MLLKIVHICIKYSLIAAKNAASDCPDYTKAARSALVDIGGAVALICNCGSPNGQIRKISMP